MNQKCKTDQTNHIYFLHDLTQMCTQKYNQKCSQLLNFPLQTKSHFWFISWRPLDTYRLGFKVRVKEFTWQGGVLDTWKGVDRRRRECRTPQAGRRAGVRGWRSGEKGRVPRRKRGWGCWLVAVPLAEPGWTAAADKLMKSWLRRGPFPDGDSPPEVPSWRRSRTSSGGLQNTQIEKKYIN